MPAPPTITPAVLLQLFRLQEAERQHVGRALHNQVGQALSAIKMGAHLVQSEDDADVRREDLQEIIRASDEAVAVARDLHATLHPPQLESIGLDAALRAESERLFPGVATALAPLPHAPSPENALVAFRIAQVLMRTIAQSGGELSLALAGDTDAAGGFILQVGADVDTDVVELPLLQTLAIAIDGGLDGVDSTHWRLRLPYAATSAPSTDPA